MQHQAISRLRSENNALRQQHVLTADPSAPVAASDDELKRIERERRELLRLRGEVGVLRKQGQELEKLRSAPIKSASPAVAKAPVESQPRTEFPRETWSFAGYETPEAVYESWVWALSKGDAKVALNSATPEFQKRFGEVMFAGKSEAELVEEGERSSSKILNYKIVERVAISEDEMMLSIVTLQKNKAPTSPKPMNLLFKRIENEWKIAGPKE